MTYAKRFLHTNIGVRDRSRESRHGEEPSVAELLLDGIRRAPSGALFVLGVCVTISMIAALARAS